ncbi:MAG: SRPBCC family protein [Rhodoferax sp.]|nr:SRPBCC family protein [Rhodoferax sp.]
MIIALVLIALVLGLLAYASTKPNQLHVERSIRIQASAETIFPYLNDFRHWDRWTPYNKDPAMQKHYSENTVGVGAHYAWEGNKQVGKGEISIRESERPSRVVMDLHMIKPFEGRNVASFHLVPDGDATRVTWSLDDKHTLMHKTMSLVMNFDQLIGRDFEVGLSRLKSTLETLETTP